MLELQDAQGHRAPPLALALWVWGEAGKSSNREIPLQVRRQHSGTAPTYLCILAVLLLRVLKPEQVGCTSELRYSENSATMASWTGATSGWTWGGGYDDEAGDEEAEMEQSRVRAAL